MSYLLFYNIHLYMLGWPFPIRFQFHTTTGIIEGDTKNVLNSDSFPNKTDVSHERYILPGCLRLDTYLWLTSFLHTLIFQNLSIKKERPVSLSHMHSNSYRSLHTTLTHRSISFFFRKGALIVFWDIFLFLETSEVLM